MFGIEIGIVIAWLTTAAPAIGAVSNAFMLGKDITSILGVLMQKRTKELSRMEKRFVDISPLAILVQRKIATRLRLLLVFSFFVGLIILFLSIIYTEQLQEHKLALLVIVVGSFLGLNSSNKIIIIKKWFISTSEGRILNEYQSCYEGYILEKIDTLCILNKKERTILNDLRTEGISNNSYNSVVKTIHNVDSTISDSEVEAIIKILAKYGYIKIERKLNMRRKFSIHHSLETLEEKNS